VRGLLRRALQLGTVLATRLVEFVDRVGGLIDRLTDRPQQPKTAPLPYDAIWTLMSAALGTDVSAILNEPALAEADAFLAEQNTCHSR
jgi:hypothetical protein